MLSIYLTHKLCISHRMSSAAFARGSIIELGPSVLYLQKKSAQKSVHSMIMYRCIGDFVLRTNSAEGILLDAVLNPTVEPCPAWER